MGSISASWALPIARQNWHLARVRASARKGVPGQRTVGAPVLRGLLRVMGKVHARRALA
jgi:hypothetical protein